MDDIGAAIGFAQPVVDRSGVQQHGSALAQRIGGLQQLVRGQVGDDEAVAAGERRRCLGDIVAVLEPNFFQREMLIEEFSGGVVVLDGKPRARDAVVLGRLFDQRQFCLTPAWPR